MSRSARKGRPDFGLRKNWYLNFVVHAVEALDLESVIGKEFRSKFWIPFDMLEEIMQATRDSSKFPNELVIKSIQRPYPLSMKVMAALRW